MSDSVREQALQALVAVLEGMTTANGYSFNPTVYRAVRELIQPLQPAINVWDKGEETEHRQRSFSQSMVVQIEASQDAAGRNFSVVGNQMIADIKRAVFSADPELGGVSEFINLDLSFIDYPDNGTVIVIAVEIVIGYNERRGDPASQPY